MIDFDLTEEHQLLEKSVREWGAREVAPRIRDLDREHRFDKNILHADGRPRPARLLGAAGVRRRRHGLHQPRDRVSEELEYVDTSLRVIMSVHAGLNCLSLLTWGTEDQKQRYLVPQAQGKKIATYGLTEPAAGSDVRGIQTVAIKKGDSYFLTGEKMWISLADVADNFLVFAWTDLEKKKQRDTVRHQRLHRRARLQGLLERHAEGEVGHPRRQHRLLQDGRHGSAGREPARPRGRGLQDRDVRARPGPLHRGGRRDRPDPRLPRRQREVRARAQDLRSAHRRAPAGEGDDRADGIRLPGVAPAVAARRWLKNAGRRNTRETGLAKWFSTVASERAAGDSVQIHGANGYSDEYPVGRFYRNCKGAVIYEGTREIHKLMQADYVLGFRQDKPLRCELPPIKK